MKRIKRRNKWLALALALLLLAPASACGSSRNESAQTSGSSPGYEMGAGESAEYSDSAYDMEESKGNSAGGYPSADGEQKIIRTGYYYLETTEYEESIQTIKTVVAQFNGYIANSEENDYGINSREWQTRSAYFIIRVPALSFDSFVSAIASAGQVVNGGSSKEDVTAQFIDMDARLKTLKVQEERLLAILETAEDLEHIIELEKALSDVRYQIESYESQKRNLESRIEYSTVEVRLQEVIEASDLTPPPRTFGERVVQGFKKSIENIGDFFVDLAVLLLTASPYLVLIAAAAAVAGGWAIKVLRGKRKSRSRHAEETGKDKDHPEE